MSKPVVQILGLALALVLASGCGRGFEAINNRPGTNNGGLPPKPVTPEEKSKEDARRQMNEDKMREDIARRNLTNPENERIDFAGETDEKASAMIRAVSLEKVGGLLRFSAVVKASEAEDAPNLTVEINTEISNEAGKVKENDVVLSSSDKVTVSGAGEQENKGLAEKYRAIFITSKNGSEVAVRFIYNDVKGKPSLADYGAMLEFDFLADSSEAVLASSSLKTGKTLPTVKSFLVSDATKASVGADAPAAAAVDGAAAAAPAAASTAADGLSALPENNSSDGDKTAEVLAPLAPSSGPAKRYSAVTTASRQQVVEVATVKVPAAPVAVQAAPVTMTRAQAERAELVKKIQDKANAATQLAAENKAKAAVAKAKPAPAQAKTKGLTIGRARLAEKRAEEEHAALVAKVKARAEAATALKKANAEKAAAAKAAAKNTAQSR